MLDYKHWFTSKTVILSALGVAVTAAKLLGLTQVGDIDQNALADHVVNIAQAVLYLGALYGRLTAKTVLVNSVTK